MKEWQKKETEIISHAVGLIETAAERLFGGGTFKETQELANIRNNLEEILDLTTIGVIEHIEPLS